MTCQHTCDHSDHEHYAPPADATPARRAVLTQMVVPWALVAALVIAGFVVGGWWGFALAGMAALFVGGLALRGWSAAAGPQRMAWAAAFALVAALAVIQLGR